MYGIEGTEAWGNEAKAIGTEARRVVEYLLSSTSQLRSMSRVYCDILAGVARGVRSLLIEEARVLVVGETEVVSLVSTRRWID